MHEVIHIIHRKLGKNKVELWKPERTNVLYTCHENVRI